MHTSTKHYIHHICMSMPYIHGTSRKMSYNRIIIYIEIWWISFDPRLYMCGLDGATKEALWHIFRQIYVQIHLIKGLVPFEDSPSCTENVKRKLRPTERDRVRMREKQTQRDKNREGMRDT